MKTICFTSIKDGSGKNPLCILAANYAATADYRVLVAALDIQDSTLLYPRQG
jgi:cellulose biosynthesis protein BcsQ